MAISIERSQNGSTYLDSIAAKISCKCSHQHRISALAVYFVFHWNGRPIVVRPAIPSPANRTFDHYAVVSHRVNCCAIDDVNDPKQACQTMNFATISFDHQPTTSARNGMSAQGPNDAKWKINIDNHIKIVSYLMKIIFFFLFLSVCFRAYAWKKWAQSIPLDNFHC